ncbi:hypothetical protein MMC10_011204 [Thelotrema lepadinum]|nr:hypothetical protein [Thelotrema lepadinum]
MNHHLRFLPSRSKSTALLTLSLCFIAVLILNLRESTNVISLDKIRSQSQKLLSSSQPQLKCSIKPHPGSSSQDDLTKLWSDVLKSIEDHAPLLDYVNEQTSLKYDRIEPVLPTSPTEATRMRSIHDGFLESMPQEPEDMFKGQGVVMVAGGSRSEYSATSLGMLRLLGSNLPIELWFVDRKVEKKGWCQSMLAEGVTCRYLEDYIHDSSSPHVLPYEDQYKTAAILFSSFSEILFLDSDSMPVVNPDSLFESERYKQNNMVVWPDFWGSTEASWAMYTTGQIAEAIESRHDHGTLDTAQILINKSQHWRILMLTTYYTHYASFFHTFLSSTAPTTRGFGACLHTALAVLKAPFSRVPAGPDQIDRADAEGKKLGSGVCVLHAHPDTSMPLFMHTSIVRFGIRDLMCDITCIEDPSTIAAHSERFGRPSARQRMIGTKVRTMGAIATRTDQVHDPLLEGRRLLSWLQLEEKGLGDLEAKIWRVLERTACQGPWMEEGLCKNIQGFVEKALDSFEPWRELC